jgi:two-component system chemotaxis response regulator CheB
MNQTRAFGNVLSAVVVIGISAGGPGTLMKVLPQLPADLKAAVIVVQHMSPAFASTLAKRMEQVCAIPFKEAETGDVLTNGKGFIAPAGHQLLMSRFGRTLALSSGPATRFMPCVNVTMESVLERFGGERMVGVLMTGMGDDGADAMVKIRRAGGITIAEDKSTAVVFSMPQEAIRRGGAEIVAPAHNIAKEIVKAVGRIRFRQRC